MKALVYDGTKAAVRYDVEVRAARADRGEGARHVGRALPQRPQRARRHDPVAAARGARPRGRGRRRRGGRGRHQRGAGRPRRAAHHGVLRVVQVVRDRSSRLLPQEHRRTRASRSPSTARRRGTSPPRRASSEYTVVQAVQCVKIDPEIDLSVACLIGCGVLTGIGIGVEPHRPRAGRHVRGVRRRRRRPQRDPGRPRSKGASRIIAVDTVAGKEQAARDFGATDFILAGDGVDVVAQVREWFPTVIANVVGSFGEGGVDYAFDCVGHPGDPQPVPRDARLGRALPSPSACRHRPRPSRRASRTSPTSSAR